MKTIWFGHDFLFMVAGVIFSSISDAFCITVEDVFAVFRSSTSTLLCCKRRKSHSSSERVQLFSTANLRKCISCMPRVCDTKSAKDQQILSGLTLSQMTDFKLFQSETVLQTTMLNLRKIAESSLNG